ncbi:MAG: methyltransferase domain-containing protein [Armatimonadetes bacterium]|nr:methyltransferase domain-containing protein [Armatimonadota bacterium]NIM24454.1 methyltransferase domain-containing protein [Armatimonadota bacterium]NIM68325.1 methyltransferase domain-containing protein [Armatimonadota bacterium]NIM76729.1 methyltransferase domain-containing protein [Armatimonadota bacterium]NIN06528.1 methyltransferase domain-containing protein [Armatimonadota bacterium]
MAWYEEFFDEDYMRFYLRGGAVHAEKAPAECDFIVKALELSEGAKVLDLCCGQGRHAVELAKRGFEITGADLSEYLLGLVRKAAEEAGVSVCFKHCDMRELPWETEFDAVINMFTSFGYFESDEENEKVLRAVHKVLRPGGRLLLDLPNRDVFVNMIPDGRRTWSEHEGCLVLDEHTWNHDEGRLYLNRTIIDPDGSRRQKYHDLRVYSHSEIADMLSRVGFEAERTFADLDMSDFTSESKRMLVVARKPGTP